MKSYWNGQFFSNWMRVDEKCIHEPTVYSDFSVAEWWIFKAWGMHGQVSSKYDGLLFRLVNWQLFSINYYLCYVILSLKHEFLAYCNQNTIHQFQWARPKLRMDSVPMYLAHCTRVTSDNQKIIRSCWFIHVKSRIK